jgi:hypothetical protein
MSWQGLRSLIAMTALMVGAFVVAPSADATAVGCAWLGESDQRDVNIGAPDLDAFYVQDALAPDPSTTITIRGRFPNARYFSFHAYDAQGNVLASIYDQQINADPGSANPFRRRPSARARDFYTLHIAFSARPSTPAENTLYVDPAQAGSAATLIYRIYVPQTPGDPSGDVGYPSVAISHAGQTLLEQGGCMTSPPPFGSDIWKLEAQNDYPSVLPTPANSAATRVPTWTRSFGSRLGNEQNAYLGAILSREYGQLVVIHARAPSFPDTLRGAPPYARAQLRYWSFCTYDDQGEAGWGCAADYAAAVRRHTLTYVISDPGNRPGNATARNGVTWLPWGATESSIQIVYRNMLPSRTFRFAAQRIQPGQSAEKVMGPYYPRAVYCSKATFERGGWRACFSARE